MLEKGIFPCAPAINNPSQLHSTLVSRFLLLGQFARLIRTPSHQIFPPSASRFHPFLPILNDIDCTASRRHQLTQTASARRPPLSSSTMSYFEGQGSNWPQHRRQQSWDPSQTSEQILPKLYTPLGAEQRHTDTASASTYDEASSAFTSQFEGMSTAPHHKARRLRHHRCWSDCRHAALAPPGMHIGPHPCH